MRTKLANKYIGTKKKKVLALHLLNVIIISLFVVE